MKSYDAIVLGAGIAGLSVARELAKRKQRVLLLEREEMGGKASRAAAGILDPYTEADQETPFLQLCRKAFDFYPTFLQELGSKTVTEIEYEERGILYLALKPADEKLLQARFRWQKDRGIPVEELSSPQILKMEPEVSNRVLSGVFYPEISKLNANRLTEALWEATEKAGVRIQNSTGEASVWIEGEEVRGVESSMGRIESPVVVLARGVWENIFQKRGFQTQMTPVRGQILILLSSSAFEPQHILHTLRWAYIVPWPNHRLLIGSTLETAGFDDRVTPEGIEDILNRVSEMSEKVRGFQVESSWAGLRPKTEDGVPLIGPTGIRGLLTASGYYRSGILIGPFVGQLLAEGIVTGKFSPLLEPLYPALRS